MDDIKIEIEFSEKKLFLNMEQYRAVTRHPKCHQRILAAAGSGKTTTLTGRIAWLLEKETIPAESIVLLTFSRNAAQQMKSRLEEFVGKQDLLAGTFHGVAKHLIREHQSKLLKKLYFIDELVTMGLQWLLSDEGQQWVSKLKYIFVDEFQDINDTQWKFLKALIRQGAYLIIVGDDAQNIYTWRGSNVKYILELHKELPGLVDDQLRSNYRSSSSIVAAANGVLRNIPSLPWKGTMIAKQPPGPKPEVHFFWRACDETAWVIKQMTALSKLHPKWKFCVLSRTNSDLFRIEESLQAQAIPYRLREVLEENEDTTVCTLDLVTLHASKGLEWDCVFLIGCNDDCFPANKKPEDIICERRLFYVGVTRAKQMLYFSYTKKERALSRFIREIPCLRLLYTGIARYTLSDVDRAEGKPRLVDVLSALDGNQLSELRKKGVFNTLERDSWHIEHIFPEGIWKVPDWAMKYDKGGDFYRFLRLWVYRHIWKTLSREEPFHEPALERILFTLRVYAEEREFFEQWRSEVFEMLHTWFQAPQQGEPPAIEFHVVKEWADKKNLFWSVEDLVKATTLLAKLRGQLRPLRFEPYDIHEFRIGFARYIVPTEWRLETLRSWRKVCDRNLGWRDILVDLWRLGALTLCAEGRNVALYRVIEMSNFLLQPEILDFLEQLENNLGPWLVKRSEDVQFGMMLQNPELFTEQLDIVLDGTFWKICVENSLDALQILELAVRGSLARQEGIELKKVGWIHPLEGTIISFDLTDDWDKAVQTILQT